jgi:hypothetical protein
MEPVAVIFQHHLLVPIGNWHDCFAAKIRSDFHEWLLENVGYGFSSPVVGWDKDCPSVDNNLVTWIWYDDRRKGIDARKWKVQGFKILFLNPRHATLAKLAWGGDGIT